jgi:hypothetical protein
MNGRWRRGSLVGPLILIGLGVIFLLNNLGLVNWDVWQIMLRLWPLLLIAIGLDILIGRRSPLGAAVVLVVVLLMLVGGVWLVSSQVTPGGQPLNSENVSQSLQGATRADVEIAPGVATLRVRALQDSTVLPQPIGATTPLVFGTVSTSRDERVTRDFQVTGNTARFVLRSQGVPFFPFIGPSPNPIWNLNLTPAVPLRLNVSTGVGDSQIDLTGLNVTSVDLSTGVGRTVVNMPAHGRFQANISGGIGEVTVRIPSGVVARIHLSAGLGSSDVSPVYQRQGNLYVSPGFDEAEDRVELEVSGGIGKVTVQEVKSQ